jgi:hypothetical protein
VIKDSIGGLEVQTNELQQKLKTSSEEKDAEIARLKKLLEEQNNK